MCGRPSVGKWHIEHRVAGWCGHVSDLSVRHVQPLVLMPFARIGSRSIARTRSAWVELGFSDPAVSTGFVHQLVSALSNIVQRGCPCRILQAICGSR
jgi:hypothetical protein